MATAQQQTALDNAKAALDAATAAYNVEKGQNDLGHQRWDSNTYILPYNNEQTDWKIFNTWLIASDASLTKKKADVDAAQEAYNRVQKEIADYEAAEWRKTHPELAAQADQLSITEQANIQKNRDALNIQKELQEKDQAFAQKRSKTILWVSVIAVSLLLIGGLVWMLRKEKPSPNQA